MWKPERQGSALEAVGSSFLPVDPLSEGSELKPFNKIHPFSDLLRRSIPQAANPECNFIFIFLMAERHPLRELLRRQGVRKTAKERMHVQRKEV